MKQTIFGQQRSPTSLTGFRAVFRGPHGGPNSLSSNSLSYAYLMLCVAVLIVKYVYLIVCATCVHEQNILILSYNFRKGFDFSHSYITFIAKKIIYNF